MIPKRCLLAAALSGAFMVAAQVQWPVRGNSETVDDFIARVIREAGAVDRSGRGSLPVVIGVKITERDDETKFAVEFSDPVSVRIFSLSNPDRIVIDMPAVQWRLATTPRPRSAGPVKSYRYGLFRPGNS